MQHVANDLPHVATGFPFSAKLPVACGHLWLHAPVLLPPAATGLFGDVKPLSKFGHSLALTEFEIGLTQVGSVPIHRVTLQSITNLLSGDGPRSTFWH